MPTSDRNPNLNDPLDSSINELETFIEETEKQNPAGDIPVLIESVVEGTPAASMNVPILDEVVSTNAAEVPAAGLEKSSVPDAQLMGLIDKLEDRLTEVLTTLVNTMKDEMIDSISEEVKLQLERSQNKPEAPDNTGKETGTSPENRQGGDNPAYGE